jgi:GTPase Era involved in 16S rRNA processing
MRQVVYFAKKIQASKVDKMKFLAKLQGHELKTNFEEKKGLSLSAEQKEKIDNYLDKLNKNLHRGHSNESY